ncbi:MAG: dihydroorotate dehydrogenase family protein [Clostridia bacterium]|jgi:dihydroorotate dehydrogenase (NAD+) catalytic subunit|nr:dihydroorotate dehydrogenase family protein [Clostridia bacterium]
MLNMEVKIGSLKLKNPIMTASGTYGFGKEYGEYYDLSKLGAVVVKGLTLKPREGNKTPRIAETPAGILNSVGLQNPGVDAFLEQDLPYLRTYDTAVIANIAGNTVEEYCEMAEKLGSQVDAIELNISCPNVKEGGVAFGTKCDSVYSITKSVKQHCRVPLIVKLSPNVRDIVEIALAAEEAGADCLSLINTLLGMAIDINCRKPILANVVGGLSGPAVKPVAVRMVYQVAKEVKIPVIGMGGISSWQDAVEFIIAGADAVAIGTYNFVNPKAPVEVLEGVLGYMEKNHYQMLSDFKGKVVL